MVDDLNILGKRKRKNITDDKSLEGKISPVGVGLTAGEIEALEAIGQELGARLDSQKVARNAIIRIAVRDLINRYRAGEIDLLLYFERPDKPKPKLNL